MAKIPQNELEQARNADLAEYLRNHGYDLKREGRSYRVKDFSGGMIVTNNKWYWQAEQVGGKSVDFLVNIMKMPLKDAVRELQGVPVADAPNKSDDIQPIQSEHVQMPDKANNDRRVIAYICRTRCITYNLVTPLLKRGDLYQDTRGNAVFAIRDSNGVIVGAEMHGTATDRRYKKSTPHTGYGFTVHCGNNPTGAMFFESAIDLLSYQQLYHDKLTHHDLISIAGVGNYQTIRQYHQQYPDRKICICCDNDTAGDNLIKKMRSELDCQIYVHRPANAHDWNDMLVSSENKSEFENVPYEP